MDSRSRHTAHPNIAVRYKVQFDSNWILGRWGFTDRTFYELGGAEAQPKHLSNAWFVQYKGSAGELGRLLSEMLNIQAKDHERFGYIFEITAADPPPME